MQGFAEEFGFLMDDAVLNGDIIAVYGNGIEVFVAQAEAGVFHFNVAQTESIIS
jgi:hypothetical protein